MIKWIKSLFKRKIQRINPHLEFGRISSQTTKIETFVFECTLPNHIPENYAKEIMCTQLAKKIQNHVNVNVEQIGPCANRYRIVYYFAQFEPDVKQIERIKYE